MRTETCYAIVKHVMTLRVTISVYIIDRSGVNYIESKPVDNEGTITQSENGLDKCIENLLKSEHVCVYLAFII